MKKIYLFLTLFCLTTLLSAQRKTEFGLVAAVGNFTFPFEKITEENHFSSSQKITEKRPPGVSYSFGIYHKWRLGAQFSLSGELLYRYSNYGSSQETEHRYSASYVRYDYSYWETRQWSESNITIPVKGFYTFRKNGRTGLMLGVGVSRLIASERVGSSELYQTSDPGRAFRATSYPARSRFSDFDATFLITAGLFQKIDANTTLGFEFSYENRPVIYNYFGGEPGIYIDCLCNYDVSGFSDLKNFSVSIRHNILR